MKKIILYLYVTFGIFLILPSCNSKKNQNQEVPIQVDVLSENNKKVPNAPIDYSQLREIKIPKIDDIDEIINLPIEDIKFIKLQTDTSCLIGNIDNIFFDNGKIIIVDKEISQAIFIFDTLGNLNSKIFNKGRGPKEYMEIRDVAVDKLNNRITIHDLMGRKLCFFDYQGNFLFSKKLKYLFSSFSILDSSNIVVDTRASINYLYPSINNSYLLLGDINGEVFYKAFPYSNGAGNSFTYFNSMHIRKFNDRTFFYPRYCDTIFEVTKDIIHAAYALNFQGEGVPKKDRENMTNEKFMKLLETYNLFGGDFIELKDFLYLSVTYKGFPQDLIFDKRSQNVKVLKEVNNTRMEDVLVTMDKVITCFGDNKIVSVVNSADLFFIKDIKFNDEVMKNTSKEFKNLLKTYDIGDNPVIFMYKLTPF